MEDDKQFDRSQNGEQEDEPERKKSTGGLDHLMEAKQKAEQEAARWKEIEDLGMPVPSQDQTPPPGPPHPADSVPRRMPTKADRKKSPPPFPHPTDRPVAPSPSFRQEASGQRPAQQPRPVPPDLSVEPPLPDNADDWRPGRAAPRPGRQQHNQYQPPPEDLDEVRLDEFGMPLPRHTPREDLGATMAARSSYQDEIPPAQDEEYSPPWPSVEQAQTYSPPPRASVRDQQSPARQPAPRRSQAVQQRPRPAQKKRRTRKRLTGRSLLQGIGLALVAGLVLFMLTGGGAAIYYSQVTAPSFRGIRGIEDLQARSLQFQTTRIRDREGHILYEINDPEGGFRDYVKLEDMSPWVIVATIATEERDYFVNPGFSIPAIVRASYQNLREGEIVSGASTITQQLTRSLLLPEEERLDRSYERKLKEVFLAAELGRRFSKTEVLELYLNQIPYGNLAYGIEAAAQTYFDKSARDLTLAEASFLAGLPQAPALYDPVTNKEGAVIRQQQVLSLMLEAGCIDMGKTDLQIPCTTSAEIEAARPELEAVALREFDAPDFQIRYPHFVVYVQQLLEADPAIGSAIYTSGFDVYTTLDPNLQDLAQQQIEESLAGLTDRNVNNASAVVIDVDTGAILAMVGSRDFHDETIDGQVNIALTPQQPGSSIKPFTYLAAFRGGWSPATVIWDVPIEYEIPGFGIYAPVDYSGTFRGPVTVRQAIANSLNVPAVMTLDHVGVPALLQVLNDVGITSLGDPTNPNNFGLSLTLGAGEVYLLEWANAFATIANGGTLRPPYAIERIERDGQVIEGYPYTVPEGEQVLDPGHAYLMQDILSDKAARVPSFGENTPLSPTYPAGAKTGTTNDFRDNWTMGFTTEIAVGVWVGNTDNSPMINVTGVTGAGPIWRGIMDGAVEWYPPHEFTPRSDASVFPQNVCVDDGALPSDYCQQHSSIQTELFASDPPGTNEGLYQVLRVDPFTNLLANEYCESGAIDRLYLVLPNHSQLIDFRPYIRNWLMNTEGGQAWLNARGISTDMVALSPPENSCGPDTTQPTLVISEPQEGSTQGNLITVYGSVDVPNFSHYRVEFGVSHDPEAWGVVQGDTAVPIINNALGQVDLSPYEDGPMTIRLIVYDTEGHSAETRVHFTLAKPTPEPTGTPEPTDTPEPTNTPKPTRTPEPTATPTPTPTSTPTLSGPVPVETEEEGD